VFPEKKVVEIRKEIALEKKVSRKEKSSFSEVIILNETKFVRFDNN